MSKVTLGGRGKSFGTVPAETVAHKISMGFCGDPKCRAVHLTMIGRDGDYISQGVLGVEEIPDFVSKLEKLASEVDTAKPFDPEAAVNLEAMNWPTR